jgi:Zn-dependent metalloprotease
VFGRRSIDGKGMRLDSTVHYGTRFENAMWNGRQMVYGDGDGRIFNRFTASLDVIGHELTHGVTQFSTALGYSGQTGALNEHLSDAFGIMVKQYKHDLSASDSDWLIGAELFGPGVNSKGVRSMAAPGTAYDDPVLGVAREGA